MGLSHTTLSYLGGHCILLRTITVFFSSESCDIGRVPMTSSTGLHSLSATTVQSCSIDSDVTSSYTNLILLYRNISLEITRQIWGHSAHSHILWLFLVWSIRALSDRCRNTKPKIITTANQKKGKYLKNQWELLRSEASQTAWSAGKWVVIGLVLHLIGWKSCAILSGPITNRSKAKTTKFQITFNSPLKTALKMM